jgi:hypothetical protein
VWGARCAHASGGCLATGDSSHLPRGIHLPPLHWHWQVPCRQPLGVNLLPGDTWVLQGGLLYDVAGTAATVTTTVDTTATPGALVGVQQGTVVAANENCDLYLTVCWG